MDESLSERHTSGIEEKYLEVLLPPFKETPCSGQQVLACIINSDGGPLILHPWVPDSCLPTVLFHGLPDLLPGPIFVSPLLPQLHHTCPDDTHQLLPSGVVP